VQVCSVAVFYLIFAWVAISNLADSIIKFAVLKQGREKGAE
jgi:hypothetical protein